MLKKQLVRTLMFTNTPNRRLCYIARTTDNRMIVMNDSRETRTGLVFQPILNERDIKWILENFFLKKLFRAIA
jgi:hypothetical protein